MSSILGPGAVVIGNVKGSGDLEVRGRVQGSITLSGRVLIAEGGVVLGDVEATQVSVAGEIRGHVLAQDGVLVACSGRVEGDIAAPRVGIEAGARVQGHLRAGGDFVDRSELLQQVAPHVSASTFVSSGSAPLPLAATMPFKAPAPAQVFTTPGEDAAASIPASQPSIPPPSVVSAPGVQRGTAGPGDTASNRPRKRKRPRPPLTPAAGSPTAATPAPAPASSPHVHKMEVVVPAARTASAAQSPARAARPRPQGPPVVPTFANGAKPRPRS